MPNTNVAEQARLRIAHSMAVVERRKSALTTQMRERLQAQEELDEAFGQAEITASVLMDLLIDVAGHIAAFGRLRDLSRVAREHRRLDIDGRHYSRFGLALGPVLDDVLGFAIADEARAAWCDAYWLVIATLGADEVAEGRPSPRAIAR